MNMTAVLIAAVSKVVSLDELYDIAEYYNYFGEFSEKNLDDILAKNKISENQAALIYHYCYLYCKLTMQETTPLNKLIKAFSLPNSIAVNSMNVITRKRIQFILDEFASKGRAAHDIFMNNESYITDMLEQAVMQPLYQDKKIFTNINM